MEHRMKLFKKAIKNTQNYPFTEWLFGNSYDKIFINL